MHASAGGREHVISPGLVSQAVRAMFHGSFPSCVMPVVTIGGNIRCDCLITACVLKLAGDACMRKLGGHACMQPKQPRSGSGRPPGWRRVGATGALWHTDAHDAALQPRAMRLRVVCVAINAVASGNWQHTLPPG